MGPFSWVSFGKSFWFARFRVHIWCISGSSHVCVYISQPRWNPPKRPMGSEHHLLWGGAPSLYELQGAFLCILCILREVSWLQEWEKYVVSYLEALGQRGDQTKSILKEISSVQFSCSVMSDSLRPHGLQHARSPCPSPTPRVYSNSCPLSRWCHPTISSSVVPFSSCLQSFPASGSFQISHFFASDGQSIGVSASASVLPKKSQGWSPSEWTGWISLQSKGFSRVFSNTTVQKH